MPPATTILLIRHGRTDGVDRYLAGRAAGTPLNDQGTIEVARLTERLRGTRLAAVVSSTLERTRQTAEAIAAAHGLPVIEDEAFNEFDIGAWTGAAFTTLDADGEWARFNAARSLTGAPGGELMREVQQRAVTAILALARRYEGGTVAVVSHGDVIRAILMYFLGMPIEMVHRIEIDPSRVSILEIGRDAVRVQQVNGDAASLPA